MEQLYFSRLLIVLLVFLVSLTFTAVLVCVVCSVIIYTYVDYELHICIYPMYSSHPNKYKTIDSIGSCKMLLYGPSSLVPRP